MSKKRKIKNYKKIYRKKKHNKQTRKNTIHTKRVITNTQKSKKKELTNIDNTNNKSIKKDNINTKKKSKSLIIRNIFLSLTITIFVLLFPLSFFLNKNTSITLIGNKSETIEVFSEYTDPGYNATLFKTNINDKIKITSDLNTKELGTYTITYELPFFKTHKETREITIVDTTKPSIKLNGQETVSIYVDDDYKEEGVTVQDNYDKDLTNNVKIDSNLDINTKGTYTITYTVRDSSNNESSITRTVKVNNKPTYTKTCNSSNPINKYICENNYNVSVGYYNLTNNKSYYYNKSNTYYGASLIKTLDALYLYENNMINDELKNHVKKVITVSDNPSHHYLVNYIGKNNLKKYGNSLGATYTLIGGDDYGITNVQDQIVYMKKLYSMTKDGQNEELKSFFLNTRKNYLLFEDSPKIMHKYGHWETVYHNAGIVLDDNPYIVVILTKEGYNNYQTIIKTLSKLIYEYHQNN